MTANKTNGETRETAEGVLLFDVESSPNVSYTWGKYDQNVLDFIKQRQIICFSWSWLNESDYHVLALPDFPGYRRDRDNNRALMAEMHKLFSRARVIIGHNLDRFDDKRANTDFIKHGFPPPPPHKTIDTLKIAKGKFDFNSNRLGDLGQFLNLGAKVRHGGFELWRRCEEGDPKAWAEMKAYNIGDVRLLRAIYKKLRPWAKSHPDLNAEDGHIGCPVCRGTAMARRGFALTTHGRAPRYLCGDCGRWTQGKVVNLEVRHR